MKYKQSSIDAAKAYFMAHSPKEAAGFLVDGDFVPLKNISPKPLTSFEIALADFEPYLGRIEAMLHSHPGEAEAYPSEADMAQQISMGVPWGIILCDNSNAADPVWFGDQCPVPPLTGPERYFRHGVTDCYSLIRDYYRLERNIIIPDFPRDWNWWEKGGDLYQDGFQKAGFVEIKQHEAAEGDVFLAAVGGAAQRGGIINHGGVYLGGSGHFILHHLGAGRPVDHSRLAVKEPGIRYLPYVTKWLRFITG